MNVRESYSRALSKELSLPGSHRQPLVARGERDGFLGELLKDVVHHRVHDGHGLGRDAGVGVHLLQDLVDVAAIRIVLLLLLLLHLLLLVLGLVPLNLLGIFSVPIGLLDTALKLQKNEFCLGFLSGMIGLSPNTRTFCIMHV